MLQPRPHTAGASTESRVQPHGDHWCTLDLRIQAAASPGSSPEVHFAEAILYRNLCFLTSFLKQL